MTELAEKPTLTEAQLSFVSLVHQHWMLHGTLMTAEYAKEQYGIDPVKFKSWLGFSNVRKALEERGVVLSRFSTDAQSWESKALTPVQLIVANTMLDLTDTRSNRKKLQDLKISTATYSAWLRDPVFHEYMNSRAKGLLNDSKHEAFLALMDKVSSGDTKALAMYFEMTGEFVPASRTAGGSNGVDLSTILLRIVEIIADEVSNPQEAAAIADRIKSLGSAYQVANSFGGSNDEDTIVVPEVAAKPVLSPALQALNKSGAGHNA